MKALLQRAYGMPDVLELTEVDTPTPGPGEVLVRVRAASINAADWFIMTGKPYIMRLAFGASRPKVQIRGRDVAGTVEAIGVGVTRFTIGDRVIAECETGSLAEFAVVAERSLAHAPVTTALQALTEAAVVTAGQRVLVNGASGGVGTFAVQIAVALGAEVTAVCSARNAAQAAELGAHRVIDYAATDFTAESERYDVVLDLVGNHPLRALRGTLNERGALVLSSGAGSAVFGPIGRLLRGSVYNLFVRQRVVAFVGASTVERLDRLTQLINAGSVTPRIEASFPLADGVAAMQRFGREHARSKIVVTVAE